MLQKVIQIIIVGCLSKMKNVSIIFILLAVFTSSAYAQDSLVNKQNYFKRNSYKRIHIGKFNSYFNDNIGIMTAGFDYGLKFIKIKPDFNLIDFGFGTNIIMAFDEQHDAKKARPDYARIVPGIEVNWSLRLYILRIQSIKTRIFFEGEGMTFVYYTKPYPDNGTNINIGSHVGMGMDFQMNNALKGYTCLSLFHTSNGKNYENNPALNAIGILMGLQF
jgi:opacity protein-like surface antigen